MNPLKKPLTGERISLIVYLPYSLNSLDITCVASLTNKIKNLSMYSSIFQVRHRNISLFPLLNRLIQ